MTTTQDAPRDGDRTRPAPQGGPAADHRPHPLDRQHHAARHAAHGHGAQPVRAREHHRDQRRGGQGGPQRGHRDHRQGRRRGAGLAAQRLADHARPGDAGPPADGRGPGGLRRRDRRGRRGPHRPPRRATPPSWSTSTTRSCPLPSTSRRRRPTRCSRTPTSAPTRAPSGSSTPPRPGTGGNVDEAIEKARGDGIVIEREYRQQRLIPAFMEPRSMVVRPDRRAAHHVVRDADPAHPAVLPGRRAGHLRSRRSGSSRPTSAAASAASSQTTPEEFITMVLARRLGKPVQVHRDPLGVADGGPPRSRPVAEADPRRPRRTAPSPGSRSSCSPTSAPTSALVGGGVPILGAFMYNAIYKFPAYQFNCRPCSPTRPGPTPTAAPAVRRRRTPSSG